MLEAENIDNAGGENLDEGWKWKMWMMQKAELQKVWTLMTQARARIRAGGI